MAYDLLILDQRIPSAYGDFDEAEAHGRYVFSEARKITKGTPIWFLTAFGMDDFIQDLLASGDQCDLWGSRSVEPLVQVFYKKEADRMLGSLIQLRGELEKLNAIELNWPDGLNQLEWLERRVVRIYARRIQGCTVDRKPLSGGLSGSRVYMATIRDTSNAVRMVVATKIGGLDEIEEEQRRYDPEVKRLTAGTYAPLVGVVDHAAANKGGLFYQTSSPQASGWLTPAAGWAIVNEGRT